MTELHILQMELDAARKRIKELEDGSCRYNCRTMKEAFKAGFYYMAAEMHVMNSNEVIESAANRAYQEWKNDR